MDENNVNGLNQEVSDEDVENVLKMLEEFGDSNEGRLKVRTGEEVESGEMKRQCRPCCYCRRLYSIVLSDRTRH